MSDKGGTMTVSAAAALERLQAGNRRFASGVTDGAGLASPARRAASASQQEPFAIILGCSDSRVPAEMVFDQGVGDLFVIRVAGNVVSTSQLGSVEFAAQLFGTRLVVVMGHSGCGAIQAALQEHQNPTDLLSPNLAAVLDLIRPSLETVLGEGDHESEEHLVSATVRAHVRASVDRLQKNSELVRGLIHDHGLRIVGAEYCLETGVVEFLDES